MGFLPFEHLPLDVGAPVGGRVCDLSGLLAEPGVAYSRITKQVGQRSRKLEREHDRVDFMEVARAAPGRGIERIDLGPGEERYIPGPRAAR